MVDAPLINVDALMLERPDMDAGVVQQLRTALAESSKQYNNLKSAVEKLEQQQEKQGADPKRSIKIGIGWHLLGRMERSEQALAKSKGALAQFYHGLTLNELGRHQDAMESLQAAEKAGYAATEVNLHKAAAYRGMKDYKKAVDTLEKLDGYLKKTAEYLYQYGTIMHEQGEHAKAADFFEKAVHADHRHSGALFQLAYYNDRNGNDDEAINYYEKCLQVQPPRLGVLNNLGLLYEDHEKYHQAAYCYEQILRIYPTHARARMFFVDAASARSQFFDEDAERRTAIDQAILDVPVSDFELSVRSRNCLRKMNINKLGDLVRITEAELLASKNFGETSLQEIKNMLMLKGLRLGQAVEATSKRHQMSTFTEEFSPEEQAILKQPVAELNLSVRARKCMTRLAISTIGELIMHTADELLECRNFGVTSLVEIREKLTERSLKLRGD